MIPIVKLGSTKLQTTQLGFGCTALMGAISERESLNLLSVVYEYGVRHFDVAPSYGYGAAEACLGKFIRKRRDGITIVTKCGVEPPKNRGFIHFARKLAGPIIKMLPGLKGGLSRAGATLSGSKQFPYTEALAQLSIERSLRELQTDSIDICLLHEPTADQLNDDRLLDYLNQQVSSGVLSAFGVGSDSSKISALYREKRDYCPILQYEWSAFDPLPSFPESYRIHHRALSSKLPFLQELLKRDPLLCKRWSDAVSLDLTSTENLSSLMLKVAMTINPASVILFSSRNIKHIQANIRAACDSSLNDPAERFYQLLQSHVNNRINE